MNDLIARLTAQIESLKDQPVDSNIRKTSERSVAQTAGVREFIIDLATEVDFFPRATWNKSMQGYGVIFAEEGSTPGVRVMLSFGSQSNTPLRSFRVGDAFIGAFDQITLSREIDAAKYNSAGEADPIRGTIRLLVLTDPSALYQSLRSGDRNNITVQDIRLGSVAWSESAARQQTNKAAGASNKPTNNSCGALDINGARGMRWVFLVPSTLTGLAIVRFWWQAPDLQGWILVSPPFKVDAVTGLPDAGNSGLMPSGFALPYLNFANMVGGDVSFVSPDIPIHCGAGRIYPELIFTTAVNGDIICQGYAWK